MNYISQAIETIKTQWHKQHRNNKCHRIRRRRRRMRHRTVPEYANCKNCGAELHGMYCHACGQYAPDVNQTFWSYINEFFQNAYQFDGRLVSTLRLLFTKPGELSLEFERGRVRSYVFPLKLYMFVSIVFFGFVLTAVLDSGEGDVFKDGTEEKLSDAEKTEVKSALDNLNVNVDDRKKTDVKPTNNEDGKLSEKIQKYTNDESRRKLLDTIGSATPLVMICLIPVYAGIMCWSFRRYKKKYLSCFVFAIHIQTMMLILSTLWILLGTNVIINRGEVNSLFDKYLSMTMLWGMFGYLVLASKRFFGAGWIKTVIKSAMTLAEYIIFSAIVVVAVILSMWLMTIA